jgi:hypothetical protein
MKPINKINKTLFKNSSKSRNVKYLRNIEVTSNIKNNFYEKRFNILNKNKFSIKFEKLTYTSKLNLDIQEKKLELFISLKKNIQSNITFKITYEKFKFFKGLLAFSKKLFNSITLLNKININTFFDFKLNYSFLKKKLSKKKVNFFFPFIKKFTRRFMKFIKKSITKNFFILSTINTNNNNKISLKKNFFILLNKFFINKFSRLFFLLNYGFFFTFLLKSNSANELNKIFFGNLIFGKNILMLKYFLVKLFRNYLFKNEFIGSNNRFYFYNKDISFIFSDVFISFLLNSSNYNTSISSNINNINLLV